MDVADQSVRAHRHARLPRDRKNANAVEFANEQRRRLRTPSRRRRPQGGLLPALLPTRSDRGYPPVSWNWATFFFGVFWFLYRRQYRLGRGTRAGRVARGHPGRTGGPGGLPRAGTTLQLAFLIAVLGVYVPLTANGLYYRWVTARVQQAKAEFAFDPKRQLEFLTLRGGPNLAAPLLGFLATVMVTFLRPAGMLQ